MTPKILLKFSWDHPQLGCQMQVGKVKLADVAWTPYCWKCMAIDHDGPHQQWLQVEWIWKFITCTCSQALSINRLMVEVPLITLTAHLRHVFIARTEMNWQVIILVIFTSAKEIMFSLLFVCLLATLRKNSGTDLHKIIRDGWPMNKWLNFGGDPDHRLDTGIVFRIHHYWETRKVISTNCAARHCSAGQASP